MGIFSIFQRKKQSVSGHILTDADREDAQEIRSLKQKIKKLDLEADVLELESEISEYYADDFADDPQNMVMELLQKAILSKSPELSSLLGGQLPQTAENLQQTISKELSEDEIRLYFGSMTKKQRKAVKKMKESDLSKVIKEKIPAISDKSLELCLKVARE